MVWPYRPSYCRDLPIMTPLILKELVDGAIMNSDAEMLLFMIVIAMLAVLLGQVICQLLFQLLRQLAWANR